MLHDRFEVLLCPYVTAAHFHRFSQRGRGELRHFSHEERRDRHHDRQSHVHARSHATGRIASVRTRPRGSARARTAIAGRGDNGSRRQRAWHSREVRGRIRTGVAVRQLFGERQPATTLALLEYAS